MDTSANAERAARNAAAGFLRTWSRRYEPAHETRKGVFVARHMYPYWLPDVKELEAMIQLHIEAWDRLFIALECERCGYGFCVRRELGEMRVCPYCAEGE